MSRDDPTISQAAKQELFLSIGTTAVGAFALWEELQESPEDRSVPAIGAAAAGLITGIGFLYFAWQQVRRDNSGM